MAGRSAVLTVRILTDADQAARGADEAASGYERFSKTVGRMAVPAAVAAGALLAGAKVAVDAASAQEQAFGAVESVYGDASQAVLDYAATAATSLGLSKAAYADAAAVIGAQLKGLGFSAGDAAQSSNDLIKMGADLAATFGGTTADAVGALSAALRGEADPAERYGLSLSQTQVNAELAAKGLDKLEGPALAAAKAQAVLDLATRQAAGALGQFERESDTASGSAAIAAASFEDAKASLGEALLPAVTAVTSKLAEMANWMGQNTTLVYVLAGIVGGLAAVVLAVNAGIAVYNAIMAIWSARTAAATAAQWLFNTALLASPITWIVLGIVALIAVVVIMAVKFQWFRDVVTAVWDAVLSAVSKVVDWFEAYLLPILTIVFQIWKLQIQIVIIAIFLIIDAAIIVWNYISGPLAAVWRVVTSAAQAAMRPVEAALDAVVDAAQAVWNFVSGPLSAIWSALKSAAEPALESLKGPIDAIVGAFNKVVDAVKAVIDWISKIKIPDLGGLVDKLNPFKSAPAPPPAQTAAVPGYPTLGAYGVRTGGGRAGATGGPAGGGGGPTIVIQGALDPVAVARQVRRVLRDDDRRRRGVLIGAAS